jgi:hypothetical protein
MIKEQSQRYDTEELCQVIDKVYHYYNERICDTLD